MSLTHQIITSHHGNISIESVLGEGTVININFPVSTLKEKIVKKNTPTVKQLKERMASLGRKKEIKIIEVSSEFFKKEYFAARPKSEKLLNSKLRLQNLDIMRDWKITLKEYMSDYYADYL